MNNSDDYLPLSGIQHFVFCRRQWALIHIERQWRENLLTAEGRVQHEKVHDETLREMRGNLIVSRGMRVVSHTLKLQGSCDAVEFHKDPEGVTLFGREGRWRPFPVEYKHGRTGVGTEADKLQLCCQAFCLEEMLMCSISSGALFYQETRKREEVLLDEPLRQRARQMADEMNALFARGYTPRVKKKPICNRCSLKDICLPTAHEPNVAKYVHETVTEAFTS